MNNPLLIVAVILCAAANLSHAQSRAVTLTVNNHPAYGPTMLTKEFSFGTNEAVEIVGRMDLSAGRAQVLIIKDGIQFDGGPGYPPTPFKIAGPAIIRLRMGCGAGECGPMMMTLNIIPESFPPDKTLIIPADTKGANILMEASADLIHWTNAPPGLYTNQPSHLFFRLRAERIP